MKKLISLILALILLVSAVPAFAASSLKPEDIIGTWDEYRMYFDHPDRPNTDVTLTKKSGLYHTFQFHADGTGLYTQRYTNWKKTSDIRWSIKGNKVQIEQEYTENHYQRFSLKLKGSSLVITNNETDGSVFTDYYKKTSKSSGKSVKKAILSTGNYNLNNSKKTAVFISPASNSVSSLKIPDTISVGGKTYKVTEIGDNACLGLKKLSSVTIGKNVKTIGIAAFAGCKALKKITFTGNSLSKVKDCAFDCIRSKATITCPKAKLSKYQKLLKKAGIPKTAKFTAK